jgi:subtilisin family serine protease
VPSQDGDNHGTARAGVACANGIEGASGVAPLAKLMPISLADGLGSVREAEAFRWAADNGADVISCSWMASGGTSTILGTRGLWPYRRAPKMPSTTLSPTAAAARGAWSC